MDAAGGKGVLRGVLRHGAEYGEPPALRTMAAVDRYSLDALEFPGVRQRIAELAQTSAGRLRAAQVTPCAALEESRELLGRAAEAMRLHELHSAPSLVGVEDLRPALESLSSGGRPLEPDALARAARTLRISEHVRENLGKMRESAPRLAALASSIPSLAELAEEIDRSIDARGEVLDQASERLAAARGRIRQLEQEVDRVLGAVMAKPDVRRALNSPKPSYRSHRPVLAIRAELRHRIPGILLDRSSTGSTVYIEPQEVVELGNALAETAVIVAREIAAVLLALARALLARRDAIALAMERLGDLDLEFAKGSYARALGATVPTLVDGRRLRIVGGRHPKLVETVQEKRAGAPSSVVPLDVEIGHEYDLLVITGPNTGGKTVALKTAGLLAVMALAGIPIPARAAEIPRFDGVFVDVGDEQAISQSLSTFSSHMVRVVRAVQNATRDSLVLLDEVGAGTDPAEGAAIGEAVLETLRARNVRTIATTHLGKLKEMAYRLPRVENATVEFDPETLQPKYRLILGIPGTSQALAVARRCGLPDSILQEAERRLERRDEKTEEAVAAIQSARIEADAIRKRAEDSEVVAADRSRLLDQREAVLGERERMLSAEAQKTIDDSLGRLRLLMRTRLDALASAAPKPLDQRLREFADEVERTIREDPIDQRRERFVAALKKDDIVFVPRLKRRCPVRRVHREKRTVTVLVGDLPTEVRFDEVTWYEVL